MKLLLYVTGQTRRARRAIDIVRAALAEIDDGTLELEIVDVAVSPDRADADRILATPTLVLIGPRSRMRLVGDPTRERLIDLVLGQS
ncbi:MAG: circadian clock KaiB family protein [Longimicrobiales bacterium]